MRKLVSLALVSSTDRRRSSMLTREFVIRDGYPRPSETELISVVQLYGGRNDTAAERLASSP